MSEPSDAAKRRMWAIKNPNSRLNIRKKLLDRQAAIDRDIKEYQSANERYKKFEKERQQAIIDRQNRLYLRATSTGTQRWKYMLASALAGELEGPEAEEFNEIIELMDLAHKYT